MMTPKCSIVIPSKNEDDRILPVLNSLIDFVKIDFECLIIVDSSEDKTIPIVKEFLLEHQNFRILINKNLATPAEAIKFGIQKSKSKVCVVTMADGSDDPKIIPDLVQLVERGVAIAAASRYMAGGQQIGAPFIKSTLSRFAGRSLYALRRVGTRDATNSFKAYSKNFIDEVGIESQFGFELALELVAKAKYYRFPVAELPTIWIERELRRSHFKLLKWLPKYLYWYLYAFKRPKRRVSNAK
jgi:glycosyltransferase involved in cell wall biosynthesis